MVLLSSITELSFNVQNHYLSMYFDAFSILLNFKRLVMYFQSGQCLNRCCAILPLYFCFECFRTIFISIVFKCRCQESLACLVHSRQSVEIRSVPCGTVCINFAFLFVCSLFPIGHCCLAFIFTSSVCLRKCCIQQQNCICDSGKVARKIHRNALDLSIYCEQFPLP